MVESRSSEHLDPERISRLLEEPEADPGGRSHLEACEECRHEYERMSRMRMALSALGELEPPAGQWAEIEARLGGVRGGERTAMGRTAMGRTEGERLVTSPDGPGGPGRGRRRGRELVRLLASWPVQVAAAVVLFAMGIMAGLQLPGQEGEPILARGETAAEGTDVPDPAGREAALRAVEDLGDLGDLLPAGELPEGGMDPADAAQKLARLEALIHASREAVERSPADPVANELLFDLVERRNALASRLHESLRLVTLEYR